MRSGRIAAASACLFASCVHTPHEPQRSSPAPPVIAREPQNPKGHVGYEANLIAFVGRKIDVQRIERAVNFDAEYFARFEVLKVVYGTYADKEISFSSFTHTGELKLEKHELGLVYVSKHDGRFVQQKYLFQPVYPTYDGRWAGCGDPYAGMPDVHRHSVRPEPIVFDPSVRFDISGLSANNIAARFPAPMFRHDGGTAICLMGNYPEELFRVMAEGVLKSRGVFGPGT